MDILANNIPANVTISTNYDGGPPQYNGSLTANMYTTVGAKLSAGVSVQEDGWWDGAFADVTVAYYFEALGPAGQNVPVILTANASTTPGNGEAGGLAQLSVFNPATGVTVPGSSFVAGAGLANQGLAPTFSVNQDIEVPANVVMELSIIVTATSGGLPSSSSAYVDPSVTIDPSFPEASESTIAGTVRIRCRPFRELPSIGQLQETSPMVPLSAVPN